MHVAAIPVHTVFFRVPQKLALGWVTVVDTLHLLYILPTSSLMSHYCIDAAALHLAEGIYFTDE